MANIILKRVIPSAIGLLLVVLAALWLYGFIGVKAGWIGPTEVPGLNAISHSGADAAGGKLAACGRTDVERRRNAAAACFRRTAAAQAVHLVDSKP